MLVRSRGLSRGAGVLGHETRRFISGGKVLVGTIGPREGGGRVWMVVQSERRTLQPVTASSAVVARLHSYYNESYDEKKVSRSLLASSPLLRHAKLVDCSFAAAGVLSFLRCCTSNTLGISGARTHKACSCPPVYDVCLVGVVFGERCRCVRSCGWARASSSRYYCVGLSQPHDDVQIFWRRVRTRGGRRLGSGHSGRAPSGSLRRTHLYRAPREKFQASSFPTNEFDGSPS